MVSLRSLRVSKKHRLIAAIAISFAFTGTELAVGFKTHSLALIADAFHYLNDLISFIVALTAVIISERSTSPQALSFGWQRAELLGAFFNGVFLLALGISIFLQSVERFIDIRHVEDPRLVLIVGCIGLGLNILVLGFLHGDLHNHGHSHSHGHSHGHGEEHIHSHGQGHIEEPSDGTAPSALLSITGSSNIAFQGHHEHRHTSSTIKHGGRDLGMLGVIIHVVGDALNNIGVIIAAVIIWKSPSEARFYADPAVSMLIAVMILVTSFPLVKNSGNILLQSAPHGVELADVKHDLEQIPGIESVHELHVWRLDQKKAIASVHVVVSDKSVSNFMEKAKTISECFHAYGIHSYTLQPELAVRSGADGAAPQTESSSSPIASASSSIRRRRPPAGCQMICGNLCQSLMCCDSVPLP